MAAEIRGVCAESRFSRSRFASEEREAEQDSGKIEFGRTCARPCCFGQGHVSMEETRHSAWRGSVLRTILNGMTLLL